MPVIGCVLLLSLLAPLVLRPLLLKCGVVDVPNHRSSHTVTAVRGLGLGIVSTVALVVIVTAFFAPTEPTAQLLLLVLIPMLLAGVLGGVEDVRGLSVGLRSCLQLLLALAVALAAVLWVPQLSAQLHPAAITQPLVLNLCTALLLIVFALPYISSFINVANFMDGLNGISAFHGVVAGVTFLVTGFVCGLLWLALTGAVLAAVFLGFLPWNLTGRGFLGDVGSYFLGAAIIVPSFVALLAGVPLLTAIAPTVVYFGDVGWTLLQRMRAGYKWSEPHKEHVYQRLQQSGLAHWQASLLAATATAVACALGVLQLFCHEGWHFLLLLLLGFSVVVLYVNLPRLFFRFATTK